MKLRQMLLVDTIVLQVLAVAHAQVLDDGGLTLLCVLGSLIGSLMQISGVAIAGTLLDRVDPDSDQLLARRMAFKFAVQAAVGVAVAPYAIELSGIQPTKACVLAFSCFAGWGGMELAHIVFGLVFRAFLRAADAPHAERQAR